MVTKEFKGLIKGEYGQAPMEIDPEFRKQIIGNDEPITCRPADLIAPELENLKKKASDYIQQDEDVLSYALFEQVAEKFFEKRRETQLALDSENADPAAKIHSV